MVRNLFGSVRSSSRFETQENRNGPCRTDAAGKGGTVHVRKGGIGGRKIGRRPPTEVWFFGSTRRGFPFNLSFVEGIQGRSRVRKDTLTEARGVESHNRTGAPRRQRSIETFAPFVSIRLRKASRCGIDPGGKPGPFPPSRVGRPSSSALASENRHESKLIPSKSLFRDMCRRAATLRPPPSTVGGFLLVGTRSLSSVFACELPSESPSSLRSCRGDRPPDRLSTLPLRHWRARPLSDDVLAARALPRNSPNRTRLRERSDLEASSCRERENETRNGPNEGDEDSGDHEKETRRRSGVPHGNGTLTREP